MIIRELHINRLFIAFIMTFVMSLQSCSDTGSDDDITPDNPDEGVENLYFSIRVRTADVENLSPEESDNLDFVDGSAFEHSVDFSGKSENLIIYFDADCNYCGYSNLQFDRLSAQGGTNPAQEAIYIGFLRPDYHEAFIMPEYGVMVLNAHDITTELDELSLNPAATIKDILALVDKSSDTHTAGRSGNYFTMTSSAYLVRESNEWKHSLIFHIDKNKVFQTRAQAVISPATIAIVERMSSKFTLTLPGATGGKGLNFRPDGGRAQVIVCNYTDGQPNYNNRTWTCSVTAWGINKYEPDVYYFRNIVGESTDVTSYPYSYGTDINSTGNPFFNGWNRTIYQRSLWAVDPHYSSGIYPAQFRPAVDNLLVDYYGRKGEPSLSYVSYNDLSTDFNGLSSSDGSVTLYSTENTFPDTRQGGRWQHDIGGCEVVVGAQIHINRVDETRPDYDLYRNRIGVFYPSATDFATYFLNTINNQLASQSTMTYRYYDWGNPENNGGTVMRTFSVNNSDYKIYYKDKPLTPDVMASLAKFTIPAIIENGDGKVLPWVDGMYIGRRAKDPNTYEEIGDIIRLNININDFKSLIYDWIGPFDHFNKGRMCYSVPVRYNASAEKVSANNYKPTIGDYGVVRNAWYRIAIEAINSLGTPVDNLDQKIIPYEASLENSILMEIKVLDWHEFSTTVTFPGSLK